MLWASCKDCAVALQMRVSYLSVLHLEWCWIWGNLIVLANHMHCWCE